MEPSVFSGNMFEYTLWIQSFEALIEQRVENSRERLFYLGKYTQGEAREAIQSYLGLEDPRAK